MTFIDISMPIRNEMVHWPSDPDVRITPHKLPEKGDRSRVSRLEMGSHTGTHVDAPRHFLDDGYAVDRIPLAHLTGPCCVVDCRSRKSVSVKDIARVDIAATPRVLLMTDNSARMAAGEFFSDYVYLESEAAVWLAEKGACLVGIDGLSIDMYHGPDAATHYTLLRRGITVVEGLLFRDVEPGQYDLLCLPLRIEGGDGAPARTILQRK